MLKKIIIAIALFAGLSSQAQQALPMDDATNAISIYPNPANSGNYFSIKSPTEAMKIVSIFDLVGNPIQSFRFIGTEYKVDLSQIPSGIYLVKINAEGKNIARKLVVR